VPDRDKLNKNKKNCVNFIIRTDKFAESYMIIDSIQNIYDKFNILPNLRMHMIRVAGVANLICDNWHGNNLPNENWNGKQLGRNDIIATALVHDLGNIVKFIFSPETAHYYGPEAARLEYWQRVKGRYYCKIWDTRRP